VSEYFIVIIPKELTAAPPDPANLLTVMQGMLPDADEITMDHAEVIRFHHCGGNFDEVRCPHCGCVIAVATWHKMMDADYDQERDGFTMNGHEMACGHVVTLNDLDYRMPMGFACFSITARNPGRAEFTVNELGRIEQAMACPVTIIHRHI
jgi:hypothetical protein